MELRPYQEEARASVEQEWEQGHKKTLLVLPTGTGKTVVFSKITDDCVRAGKRVLIMAHRGELLDQAAEKLKKTTGLSASVEKAELSCLNSLLRVTVGSVQTLGREKRLEKFSDSYFDTIIIDEAHHAISKSYQNVLQYFSNAEVLGVTATPDRADMKDLGSFFDSLAYEYSLPQAVRDGYLVPIKAQTIPLQLDISKVAISAGDFKASDVDDALAQELEQMKKRKRKLVDPLQFELSIGAEDLSSYVPSFGWEVEPVTDKQKSKLEKFGIFPDEIESAGKAAVILKRLMKRVDLGLSTPKRIRFLERNGFQHVGTWSFKEANGMITRIAACNWRIPRGINPMTYKPVEVRSKG